MRKKVHAPSFLLDSNPPQKGALLIIQGRRSLGPMKQPGPSLAPHKWKARPTGNYHVNEIDARQIQA